MSGGRDIPMELLGMMPSAPCRFLPAVFSCLLWLTTTAEGTAFSVAPVGPTHVSVGLGQAVTFQCSYDPQDAAKKRGLSYKWERENNCSGGYPSMLQYEGVRDLPAITADKYLFDPEAAVGPKTVAGNTSMTVLNTTAELLLTNCSHLNYICTFYDANFIERSAKFFLDIYDPAYISTGSFVRNMAKEGDRVVLSCDAAGIPAPTLLWTKQVNGEPSVLPTGGYAYMGQLPSFWASADSSGNYTCFAKNNYGNASKFFQVLVTYKPIVTADRPRVAQAPGYYASVTCEARSAEPLTAVWWQHKGRRVAQVWPLDHNLTVMPTATSTNAAVSYNARVIVKNVSTSGRHHYMSELLLGIADSDYQDVFECHFANRIGSSSKSIGIIRSSTPVATSSDGIMRYHGDVSSSAILRASLLLLLLGFLLHDLL